MTKTPDPLAEALALLGDPEARHSLVEAVEAFHRSEALRHAGPAIAARLEALATASALVATAAADRAVLDWLCPAYGHLPTSDPEALASAGGIEIEAGLLEDFGTLARLAHQRLEAATGGPSARWRLLSTLVGIWNGHGHHPGTSPRGRFMQFATAVGEFAGVEITHHSVRQVCERYREMEARSHTARPAIAA